MISFSQNLEDVILRRVLGDVQHGFYIDIGAAHPDLDSVTKSFYDSGWRGVNIEPNPEFYDLLLKRDRDINLSCAAGAAEGELEFSIVQETGLSTFRPELLGDAAFKYAVNRQMVLVRPLRQIWSDFIPQGEEVHFLKVDVEGFEEEVLNGADWVNQRPWVVLVEATTPGSQVASHLKWEHILTGNGYSFVYFDGLNRFYLAAEQLSRERFFSAPPNIFDGFVRAREATADTGRIIAEEDLAEAVLARISAEEDLAEAVLARISAEEDLAEAVLARKSAELASTESMRRQVDAQQHLAAVFESKSWRWTRALRAPQARIREVLVLAAKRAYSLYLRSSFFRTLAQRTVMKNDRLTHLLASFIFGNANPVSLMLPSGSASTARTRRIEEQLALALATIQGRQNRENSN